jgi:hypothetical protein
VTLDYRSMLKKYINHVVDEEGIDFIDRCLTKDCLEFSRSRRAGSRAFPIFTDEEINELRELARWNNMAWEKPGD